MENNVEEFVKWIKNSDNIVFFGGAGVSTESGIPDFDILKKIGVVLKRAHYFITCNGRMMYRIPIEESYITECLTDDNHKENWEITHQNEKYQQLSLFE